MTSPLRLTKTFAEHGYDEWHVDAGMHDPIAYQLIMEKPCPAKFVFTDGTIHVGKNRELIVAPNERGSLKTREWAEAMYDEDREKLRKAALAMLEARKEQEQADKALTEAKNRLNRADAAIAARSEELAKLAHVGPRDLDRYVHVGTSVVHIHFRESGHTLGAPHKVDINVADLE